jgi:hypothetical protein
MSSADFSTLFIYQFPDDLFPLYAGFFQPLAVEKIYRPPGVSNKTFDLLRRIYTSYLRMTFGLPDSRVSYPVTDALYPVSVRRSKSLPPASFRFHLTVDTLAFAMRFRSFRLSSGLVFYTHPLALLHARHTRYLFPNGNIRKTFAYRVHNPGGIEYL